MNRRGFLASILAAGYAPAAIGSGILMPVKALALPRVLLQAGKHYDVAQPTSLVLSGGLPIGTIITIYNDALSPLNIAGSERIVLASQARVVSRLPAAGYAALVKTRNDCWVITNREGNLS